LTYRRNRHNLENTEIAFGNIEGLSCAYGPHAEERAEHASRRMAAGAIRASWFETALSRLLTMRS